MNGGARWGAKKFSMSFERSPGPGKPNFWAGYSLGRGSESELRTVGPAEMAL